MHSDQSLLFFSVLMDTEKLHFVQMIESMGVTMEVFHTLRSFSNRLRRSLYDIIAAVILTADHAELESILSIKELLMDVPIFLCIPDEEESTIIKGYQLKPRYLSPLDDCFHGMSAIMEEWIQLRNHSR